MSFTIRCARCNFGNEIPTTTLEWLCPKCGTKMIIIKMFRFQVNLSTQMVLEEGQAKVLTSRCFAALAEILRTRKTEGLVGG